MGQFKPMVKMETTEPSVELKLKKGGKVAKKADGGMMGAPMSAGAAMPPSMPARGGMPMAGSPMKPSLAMRRRAMKGLPAGAGPAGPVGGAASMQPSMSAPMSPQMPPSASPMKKGGKADMGQDKAMVKKAFKQHDMQEHKGGKGTKLSLKKGGKMATGGVVDGQGGYAKGGIINTEGQGGKYRNTKMDTAKPDRSPAKTGAVKSSNGGGYATGGVAKSNGGGYKTGGKIKKMAGGGLFDQLGGASTGKPAPGGFGYGGSDARSGLGAVNEGASTIGGALDSISNSLGTSGGNETYPTLPMKRGGKASKKAYAAGGTVNSGRPVAMPQGRKPASKPVRINELAGTYKAGGKVTPAQGRLQKISAAENAPSFRAAKMNTNEKYGPASMMKLKDGGTADLSKGAYDKSIGPDADDISMARSIRGFPGKVFDKVKGVAKDLFSTMPKTDSVTKTKESVTVSPAKKRGGAVNC